ncbi:BrnT family toxin [Granulicella rosea]|nr:BrnT family toxin [Granulicella rosea]
MDVLFRYEGLDFVWDVHKAASNLVKHGVRFELACQAFLDPFAQLRDAGIDEEIRSAIVGETEQGRLLFVVHIERDDEAIRIISARQATAQERKSYEDYA